MFARGYWSTIYVRDGDVWKIRMSTFNQTPSPVAPAETKLMRRRRGDGGSKNSGEDNEDSLSPTLAELAIGFAVPAIAQEQNTGAPEVRRQIEAGRGLTY